MPASQLKRLKASLREQGITGQQKSKKEKKTGRKNASDRVQRNAALQQIRNSFNPFEFKAPNARPEKFASVSQQTANAAGGSGRYKEALLRPGVSKSAGEEMRRATLLPELRRRNKVGGLVDRRIGEGDVDMTPEERAVQRFAREKERKGKGASLFDLEASDDEGAGVGSKLTHGGRSLEDLDPDDFDDAISEDSLEDDGGELLKRKRRRSDAEEAQEVDVEDQTDQPERKKTKKEVMEEVIAKSKLHKYERQKAKEDDEDLREELDKGFGEMMALLQGVKRPPPVHQPAEAKMNPSGPTTNPDRQRLINGASQSQVDKDYELRLKQLARDTRAQPSDRTKTAEEKALAEAERLRELEAKRLRRMEGDAVSDDEPDDVNDIAAGGDEDIPDQAAEYGFTSSAAIPAGKAEQLVLEDEDEFALDEDLVASGSDAGLSDLESQEDSESSDEDDGIPRLPEDEEDEFIKDVLGADVLSAAPSKTSSEKPLTIGSQLAYTYPCPRSHEALLDVVNDHPSEQLPTIIQRIRALYHHSLSAANKESMADFSQALVEHLAFMGNERQSLVVAEQVIRHLHSLSRTYPIQIADAFRRQLGLFHARGQPNAGDLVILTAIGSIYPTSDHWHQVVTPAITIMARWLGLNSPAQGKPADSKVSSTGAFLVALCVKYQSLSKRYVPEALRFTLLMLSTKAADSDKHVANLTAMAELWKSKSAFIEMFAPAIPLLKELSAKKEAQHLRILLAQARTVRRPLQLHNHRPLPLRTSVPKFEENFNPDKHYDPDKERSDAKKLQKEYKRERKGALRELRKDANFIAREQLKEKRARDDEYEKKYRKLVASVQAEEGHEAKQYAREKAARSRNR